MKTVNLKMLFMSDVENGNDENFLNPHYFV